MYVRIGTQENTQMLWY